MTATPRFLISCLLLSMSSWRWLKRTSGIMAGPALEITSFSFLRVTSSRFQLAMTACSWPSMRRSLSSRNRSGSGCAFLPEREAKESEMSPSALPLEAAPMAAMEVAWRTFCRSRHCEAASVPHLAPWVVLASILKWGTTKPGDGCRMIICCATGLCDQYRSRVWATLNGEDALC